MFTFDWRDKLDLFFLHMASQIMSVKYISFTFINCVPYEMNLVIKRNEIFLNFNILLMTPRKKFMLSSYELYFLIVTFTRLFQLSALLILLYFNVIFYNYEQSDMPLYFFIEMQKDLTPRVFPHFSQCTEFLPHRGFKLMSSRSGVRHSN